jgi:glycosyltransferase involved in cell wall biosynthesis
MTAETMPDRPTISLIIPAYNEEAYLGACLDAVMANIAGKAFEVIVVDNNSTDGTKAVAERYPAIT